MAQRLRTRHYDVVVIGGGSAGVTAAIAAAKNGAQVLLIESGPAVGGELLSGLPIDGGLNALGEWIIGGIAKEFFDGCEPLGGYVGPVFDWRLNWAVCVDPEILKLVIVETLARHKVSLLLYTFAEDVVTDGNKMEGVVVVNKSGRTLVTADVFVDCSGDGDVATMAGAESERGGPRGEFQPVSLVFRMGNVDFKEHLEFVRDNPREFILAESPIIEKTPTECAQEIFKSGLPFTVLSAEGSLLGQAIKSGEMYPTTAVYTWPTSIPRKEVGLNTTRLADLDATDTEELSKALSTLTDQVGMCHRFLQKCVPGFRHAYLSGIAPKIGVRETRRIIGEHILTAEEVINGRKSMDGIGKGSHHIDIHGSGTFQKRVPVNGGQSYDIPYGCLVPRSLENLLVAGRCLSSTREANGSARVMGQCMATGEAAGTAAAMCVTNGWLNVRNVPMLGLRETLKRQGAIIDGTE